MRIQIHNIKSKFISGVGRLFYGWSKIWVNKENRKKEKKFKKRFMSLNDNKLTRSRNLKNPVYLTSEISEGTLLSTCWIIFDFFFYWEGEVCCSPAPFVPTPLIDIIQKVIKQQANYYSLSNYRKSITYVTIELFLMW